MGRLAEGKTLNHLPALAQIRPWHRQLARAVAAGARPQELCLTYGYSSSAVSRILASPLFQAEVARIEVEAEEASTSVVRDLRLMSRRAVEILDETLDESVENWQERTRRAEVAFGILDRAGYGKTSKVTLGGEGRVREADPMQTEFLRELGREVAKKVISGELKALPILEAQVEANEP